MRARTKQAVIRELYSQFIQYGITEAPTSYNDYLNLVGSENSVLTRRAMRKIFSNRWARCMSTLTRAYPDLYKDTKKAHAPLSIEESLAKAAKVVEEAYDE